MAACVGGGSVVGWWMDVWLGGDWVHIWMDECVCSMDGCGAVGGCCMCGSICRWLCEGGRLMFGRVYGCLYGG